MLERKIENRQLLNIITLFAIVQFAGLLITIYLVGSTNVYQAPTATPFSSVSTVLAYLAYIVILAAVLVFVLKKLKGDIIFILLEGFVVLFATAFLLFAILSTALPNTNYIYIAVFSVVVTLALIVAKNYRPKLRNFIAITSSIGVGVIIGLEGFNFAYLLMLFIAIYDYIAVFITKHMIELAKIVSSKNMALLIGSSDIEVIPKSYVTAQDRADFKKAVNVKQIKDPILREQIAQGNIPMLSQVQLGTGDLAIPLMLTASAYITFLNYTIPVMIVAGSTCGLIFTMYLLKKYQVALPAIPPIFAFINLFLGIVFLTTKTKVSQIWPLFILVFITTLAVLILKLRENE